ncbi:glycerol-3-phosphate 1-O-acyltransferase PlsY [bacterium]|nr:glycerol-3-phosphate 1-O-acyltransferase PlsY [bacterium]
MESILLIVLLSYLIGSFPTSVVVGRMIRRIDIREHGSRNAGGTNVLRILGWKAAVAVIAVDIGKGILATALVAKIRIAPIGIDPMLVQFMAGSSAIVGHIWTVLAHFKGGKGVATAGGMLIALFPWAALICAMIFLTIVLTTRYVSVGSLTAASSLPFVLMLLDRMLGRGVPNSVYIVSFLVSGLIVFTHRANIRRLINGTENRFSMAHFRRKF